MASLKILTTVCIFIIGSDIEVYQYTFLKFLISEMLVTTDSVAPHTGHFLRIG